MAKGAAGSDRKPVGASRAGALAVALAAVVAACSSSAATPLQLPPWFESTARWRNAAPPLDTTQLDAAIARHARAYKALHGAAHYREFALAPPRPLPDVTAAIDSALAAAQREASRQAPAAGAQGEHEARWTTREGPVVMVLLPRADAARADAPAFVLLFEPK